MSQLFRLASSVPRDSEIEAWLDQHSGELGRMGRYWFEVLRKCGADVRERLHDGHPIACIGTAAFAYVNVYTAHINVGFFRGAELSDPHRLLEGTGKLMRHVKLRPDHVVDTSALMDLIQSAYSDMRERLKSE